MTVPSDAEIKAAYDALNAHRDGGMFTVEGIAAALEAAARVRDPEICAYCGDPQCDGRGGERGGSSTPEPHAEVETPGWDTKLRCACGAEFATKHGLHCHFDDEGAR